MLSRLHLQNFTVFADADFHFSPGLNVLIGTNGTGKSHVLKVGYAVLSNTGIESNNKNSVNQPDLDEPRYVFDILGFGEKLTVVFQTVPEYDLGKLVRHGGTGAGIHFELENGLSGDAEVNLNASWGGSSYDKPARYDSKQLFTSSNPSPLFIPAKEVTTLGWMLPASEQLRLPIDRTYLDLLKQLRGLPLRQPEPAAAAAIKHLTDILGGEVEEEGGRYYLTPGTGQNRMEMNMVAEGLRKFGTLQKLLSNGSLTPRATLFWDEPEANLNPALLRQLAEVLTGLARAGFQIILATHSLFLLKQFHILSRAKDQSALLIRYFGLNAEPGGPTEVTAVDDFELLPDVLALDEELAQADKLTILFAQDDAHTDGR
jgi:energy-coupling factor transporter ATP-binding protein EcfA2